jgi:hypothetical protein
VDGESESATFPRHASEMEQPPAGCLADADSGVDMLTGRLIAKAQQRTIRHVVAGGRFCAVVLDDGGVTPDLLPEDRAAELLPQCSVALITATTLTNGTIGALLVAAANCRKIVLFGPSTPLVPGVFAASPRRASLVSGVLVTDGEELLRTVARDGGTRDLKTSVAKVNVRANVAGSGLSEA